jgi:hypothetical protein
MFDLAEPEAYFARYAPLIRDLPDPLERETLCSERFLLHQDGRLRICYVPFDHVNVDARATIVGVTPGWLQMEIGYRVARDQLRAGAPTEVALAEVKKAAAFAGTMRRNLLSMLDEIGLPEALGIASSSCLFDTRADLLHSTSAVRYPVFVDGENYTGSHPALLKAKALRDFVERCLAPELQVVAAALIIPLGSVVERCLRLLVNQGVLDPKRCLFGFPHPSGANGHRRRQFDERRDDLQRTVRDWFRPMSVLELEQRRSLTDAGRPG